MKNASSPCAVIMGDLIAHRENRDQKDVHRRFNEAVERVNDRYRDRLLSPLTITLGDEFQGLSSRLCDAFEIALEMRLMLLAFGIPCRFVVGSVSLATPLNPARAWNMMGPGLAEARERLNDKRDDSAYRFSLEDDPVSEGLLDTLGYLLTQFENDWTPRQRDFSLAFFRTPQMPVSAIARTFDVSPRNVNKVLKAAGREYIHRIRTNMRDALTAIDKRRA